MGCGRVSGRGRRERTVGGKSASAFVAYQHGKVCTRRSWPHPYPHTNNFAEYFALIMALNWVTSYAPTAVLIRSASQLMVRQINGEYRVKHKCIQQLLHIEQSMWKTIPVFLVDWVCGHAGCEGNEIADRLCTRRWR